MENNTFNTNENDVAAEAVETTETVETVETVEAPEAEAVETEAAETVETVEAPEAPAATTATAIAAAVKPNTTLGLISMICGITSIVFACCCGWLGAVLGVAAVVLAIVEYSKNKKMSGFAIAGIICGAVGIVVFVISMIINILISMGMMAPVMSLNSLEEMLGGSYDYYDYYSYY